MTVQQEIRKYVNILVTIPFSHVFTYRYGLELVFVVERDVVLEVEMPIFLLLVPRVE